MAHKSDTGPCAVLYGADDGYPTGTRDTYSQPKYLVGSLSNYTEVFKTYNVVERAGRPARPLIEGPEDLSGIRYRARGKQFGFEEFFERNPVTSFLLLRDDAILYERYQYARRETDRFASWSMAKTVVAMLVGIAVGAGDIKSIDDKVGGYLPELAGLNTGDATIRHFLEMTSGNDFKETDGYHNPNSAIRKLSRRLQWEKKSERIDLLREFSRPAHAPGATFNYSSFDTLILGEILSRVTGTTLSKYLSEKIWQHIDAEADAYWITDLYERELPYCCLNATLRDYGRLGRLLAHDGILDDRELIPRAWVSEATTLRATGPVAAEAPGKEYFGYGYQVWILPDKNRRMFSLRGIRGQAMYVDPKSKLVMVQTSANVSAVDPDRSADSIGLWWALVKAFG